MVEQLTSAQMAVRVGISERSIQRWIQEGRLSATRIEDSALYEVESSDLERLRLKGHREEESRLQAVERAVNEMAERLSRVEREATSGIADIDQLLMRITQRREQADQIVERRLKEMKQEIEELRQLTLERTTMGKKPRKEAEAIHVAEPQENAPTSTTVRTATYDGLVSAVQFAIDHGISKDAAKSAFKRQTIKTTKVGDDNSHYLSQEQRQNAISYWQKHKTPGFHPCDNPECPCQSYTQPESHPVQDTTLPDGYIPIYTFLKQHPAITRADIEKLHKEQNLPIEKGNWKVASGKVKEALSPEGIEQLRIQFPRAF